MPTIAARSCASSPATRSSPSGSSTASATAPARVIAGDNDYGLQLDGQLRLAGLRRTEDADVIVLAGLVGEPEAQRARDLAPLPIIAFDGIQGEAFPGQDVELALVYAAGMVVATTDLAELRRDFDEFGDPLDPPVYFERYEA